MTNHNTAAYGEALIEEELVEAEGEPEEREEPLVIDHDFAGYGEE